MGSKQIVFLFDLNLHYDELAKCRESLSEKLLHMRLACLRLLTDFSTKTSNLRWGFKFFDSGGSVTQTMPKLSFSDLSLESFETFENEICIKYERHVSFSQALAESSRNDINLANDSSNDLRKNSHISPVKILQLAITQILSEFQWEYTHMWSPQTKHFKKGVYHVEKRNVLVFFGDFEDNEKLLLKYFGVDQVANKSKFASILLPQALREKVLEKADINWIWINIAQNQNFLSAPSSKTLQLLSLVLNSIQGSLIPLSLLSQSIYHAKLLGRRENDSQNMSSIASVFYTFSNSLLPFSTIYHHSLHQPFYCNTNESEVLNLSIAYNKVQIPVQLIKILKRKFDCCMEDSGHNDKQHSIPDTKLSKIIIRGCVSRKVKFVSYDILLCLPNSSEVSGPRDFMMLIVALSLQENNLVLTCVTDNGLEMLGLLIPVSNDAAVLSIVNPIVSLCSSKKHEKNTLGCKNELSEEALQNFKTEFKDVSHKMNGFSLKQFQVESLEHWYTPTSVMSELSSHFQAMQSKISLKVESFHKLLKQSVENKNNDTSKPSKENVLHTGANLSSLPQAKADNEILVDLNFDELLSTSKNIYDSAIESSISILDCAKKILKMVSHYYKKHGGSSFEENVLNFMKENFFMTVRRISEKYEMLQSDEDINKKIKECQMQVFLTLETEALTLPPDKSICVNTVTAILRMMSFYSGAMELNKLLCEMLRENYSNKLYDVLVDIGDELDMPIFEEAESSDSPDVLSSELMEGELFGSVLSSDISIKSSSSACSRKDNRKLTRYRSDISDTNRSRQVLLPGTSPKKKKGKSTQKKAVRCSPRLASRKSERSTRSKEGKQKNVRRNLFPKEKNSQSPKKSAGCPTPKSKKKSHASKTKFVAETPSHKQNHSALQRRKSYIEQQSSQNSPKVIAESPSIIKTAKNDFGEEFLQKLKEKNAGNLKTSKESSLKKAESPFKHIQYTPESKRRLSLKLFSKILSSPTARMGIKKCTKRLFDQVSPSKSSESSKKFKSFDESKFVTSAETQSCISNLKQ